MASSSRTLDHGDKTDLSYSGEDIFLSHSGKQKFFVEVLYNALESATLTAFFDKISLPKAEPFPEHIKKAARGCKVGVLVLSDDFLKSKWPMLELEIMVDRGIKLLPLFYKLSPEDLKKKLSDWQNAWEKWEDVNQSERWEKAVKKLRSYNGIILQKGESENDYIDKVVTALCNLVASRAAFDLSSIEGLQHLAEEVQGYFDFLAENAKHCEAARMVGLHGVGGLGKTTLCKIMVNHYTSLYCGRSLLIKFPTDGDESEIVRVCKMALKKLCNLRDQVLEVTNSFDEVIKLMKNHATKYNLFLAIDNVWPKCEEEAKRLLGVGFTADSKILLTSRSGKVLRKVLLCHKKNSYIGSLPTLNDEDALKIIQNNLSLGDFTSLQVGKQIETAMKRYMFNFKYNPLALKALGRYLESVWEHGDSETNGHDWARILEKIDHAALQSVLDAIKLNYDGLSPQMKQMFLDIALWIPRVHIGYYKKRTIANAVQWLQFFFESYPKDQIGQCIRGLDSAGVIQIEVDEYGEEMIGLHDLYFDMALKEATSTRFLTLTEEAMERMCGRPERSVLEEVIGDLSINKLQQSKRLLVEGVTGDLCTNMLQWSKCSGLQCQLLYADNIDIWRKIHLPALRVLILKQPRPDHSSMGLKNLISFNKLKLDTFIHLKFLSLQDCNFVKSLESLSSNRNLQMLHIERCVRLQNLDGLGCLTELKALKVQGCKTLKKVPDLGGVTGLESLTLIGNNSLQKVSGRLSPLLKEVRVKGCCALKKLPDLGGATGLERLTLCDNKLLEEVTGLLGPALKEVDVKGCSALKKLPDLGSAIGLERLTMIRNGSLQKVSGCLGPALKEVRFERCSNLKKLPDLGGATGLERLTLVKISSLEEVSGLLSPALKEVRIEWCGIPKKLPNLGGATALERLALIGNDSLEEVSGCLSPALKEVRVEWCSMLKKLPDLDGATGLERFTLIKSSSLEEVSGLLGPALMELRVEWCSILKKLPDLGGATGLERLTLIGNDSLEEVSGCLSPALKEVRIEWCSILKKLPDLGGATGLKSLTLVKICSLEEVSGLLGPALKEVRVEWCSILKKLPDFGDATALERLTLIGNDSLEEVSGRFSPALKGLRVEWCSILKKLPDLGGATGLQSLTLVRITSLEELSGVLGPALKGVRVEWCSILKKLPDLGDATGLERLTLIGNDSLEEVGGRFSPALKEIRVEWCSILKKLPDLGVATGLERLTVCNNDSLRR